MSCCYAFVPFATIVAYSLMHIMIKLKLGLWMWWHIALVIITILHGKRDFAAIIKAVSYR